MTNPPTPPYTEATVELAVKAINDWHEEWNGEPDPNRMAAVAVLNALVKAGLLLPEGAETRTEAKPSTKDLPLQPGDQVAFMSPSLFPGREAERLTGQVVGVADDGYVTASVPQTGYGPMEVTAPADEFVRVRTKSDVLGAAFRAGRAQAAADIRAAARIEYGVEHAYPGQEPIGLPAVNRWAAERAAAQSGGVATRRLVERTTWSTPWREAAERDEDSRTDVDEPTLLVGTAVPDPRAETEDGGAQ